MVGFKSFFKKNQLLSQCDEFLSSSWRSKWIENKNMRIYIRKSKRVIDGKFVPMIDVANILTEVPGTGDFKSFMLHLENKLRSSKEFRGIYVENIENPRLEAMLRKHGYVTHNQPYTLGPPCLHKLLN